MKVKHNKKRNVGLLFAQLSQSVSESMVEGDSKKAAKTLSIIKKHFVPGTELFKEFRLFRAIMVTSVPTDSLASSIIFEAKAASRNINTKTLTQQKSSLIKDINYEMNESSFYNRRVADYKTFATVQTLLSEWRNRDPNLSVMAKFETELHTHLLKEKKLQNLDDLKSADANHLVVDIMRKKIEEKFGSQLTSSQLSLLKEYVFFDHENDNFSQKLSEIKRSTILALSNFEERCDNQIIKTQIPRVRESVDALPTDTSDDETLSRYLTLMKLTEELTTGDEGNE